MWTDFWGDSPKVIEEKIKTLKDAQDSGTPVEIIIAGVKTRFAESRNPQLSIKIRLADAQEYAWRISESGGAMDWSAPLRPRAYRNRQTIVGS